MALDPAHSFAISFLVEFSEVARDSAGLSEMNTSVTVDDFVVDIFLEMINDRDLNRFIQVERKGSKVIRLRFDG